ncbi:hypothetical protein GJV85_01780 [Sulfurimonas aquatica]|uniref:Plasminogen-binding protein PgbA N-terminal domain-containing protein n=1 Tax=Sulfurimonas aquatica TaxID=2672570 RepID=A0A975AYM1_9BACT|nr:plasminogen-binding N-terminal domain-containing protein [Sulfurimonas aquatica]QSZ40893.1 hypothetical protein GJV85_01780 [Sulfurimonas aquatica]
MKYIFILIMLTFELFSAVVKAPILSLNEDIITIEVDRVDVGMSGFVVHKISDEHSIILKNTVVLKYDKESKIATLKMSEFTSLNSDALPRGKWKVEVGDEVELAFGYSRAILIAPSEEVYHRVTKSVNTQWVHSDIFATSLSYTGHPTPLIEDFQSFGELTSVGLLFIFLDKKLYTIDIQSFKILNISDAPLEQEYVELPFHSRVEKIAANWFGKGSSRLKEYEPYYYTLLAEYNKDNRKFYEILKEKKLLHIVDKFEIGE